MRARSPQSRYNGDDLEQSAIEQGSPELVQELLETNGEWTNIQDIVKMTFKGIFQAMMVQKECIRDIEAILPEKANIGDLQQELRE